ncbi:MAG: TetR/AcrR family transcriptional regulator [Acidobacteriaceae bacterium]|nr:TetR/AcrR family transcriptional regulator [Acidobacteriaceae bacterium]
MPRLLEQNAEKNKLKISRAALYLFTHKGFHGTSVREIADKAGVSMGNLYTYYRTKEEIFVDLIRQLGDKMETIRQKDLIPQMQSLDPESLNKLALAIGRMVGGNLDYWRLMYIDVVEFRHKYFAHGFQQTAATLRKHTSQVLRDSPFQFPKGVDPGLAYTSMYLHFFTYFLVEELFGAKHHLGMDDEQAIEQLVRLYTAGMSRRGRRATPRRQRKERT